MERDVDASKDEDPDHVVPGGDEAGSVQLPSQEDGHKPKQPGQIAHGPVSPVENPSVGGAWVGAGQGHDGLEEGQAQGQHAEHGVGVLSERRN